jgi:hypothetical protein
MLAAAGLLAVLAFVGLMTPTTVTDSHLSYLYGGS